MKAFLLLSHVSFLETTADELDCQGLPGHELRGHYRKAIGLSDAEDAILRESAREWKRKMTRESLITTEFMRAYQTEFKGSALPQAEVRREIKARAKVLTRRRVALVIDHLEDLARNLGADAAGKLDRHVKEAFAGNVSANPIPVPSAEPTCGEVR